MVALRRYAMVIGFILSLSISFSVTKADASVFVVTTDVDQIPGACDADCSMVEAVRAANADPDYSIIQFNIPGAGIHHIHFRFGFNIVYPVMIDGTTQPGYAGTPLIELSGDPYNGVAFYDSYPSGPFVDGNTIRGLSIINYDYAAISFYGNSNNIIEDNYIGVTADGLSAPGNGFGTTYPTDGNGIELLHTSSNNIIRNNVISGNHGIGIGIGQGSHDNVIEGNYIGTNPAGTAAIGVPQSYGILIAAGTNNRVGGISPTARNIISGNQVGLFLLGTPSGTPPDDPVQGNYIGTDVTGTLPIGNIIAGVRISGLDINTYYPTENYTIGGTNPGEGNLIAFNGIGVEVQDVAKKIAIEGNSIHSNVGLGIDLNADGATPNDDGDTDTGQNNLQNYPILTDVERTNNQLLINGHLNSAPNKTYRVELFANDTCNASGNGEGETFLTALNVSTNGSGNATFVYQQPWNVNLGGIISATATDPDNNTSEFSPCFISIDSTIPAPPIHVYDTDTPVLTWNRITGAAGYEVQVSTKISFGLPYAFHDENIPADQLYVQTGLLGDGTYYWRVRAKDSNGKWGAWSDVQTFEIAP